MKTKMFALLITIALLALTVTAAAAKGESPAKLNKAGWTCMIAGPHQWVHCVKHGFTGNTVLVKVFDTHDTNAEEATFLGTELLIHKDIYKWQPCPQNGEEMYDFLEPEVGLPYYACHHFDAH